MEGRKGILDRRKIGIAGADSFWWRSNSLRRTCISFLDWYINKIKDDVVLVIGKCPQKGVDYWAEEIAGKYGVPIILFPPRVLSWEDFGNSYGYKTRNNWIVENSDEILLVEPFNRDYAHKGNALWDGKPCSGGYYCYQYAKRLGKPAGIVQIYWNYWKVVEGRVYGL